MSQENVELVRRIWDIYVEGGELGHPPDSTAVAPYDEGLLAPESTYTPDRQAPDAKTYVGREGFADFFREWSAQFTGLTVRPQKVIDAGDDRVVAVVHASATGKGSGAVIEFRLGIVYTLAGGRVVDRQDYLDPGRAFEAVGL